MELITALGALQTTIGLARVAVEARDDAKLQSAMQDLSTKLSDALVSGMEANARALQLQNENEKLRKQLVDLESYVLAETIPGSFAMLYKVSPNDPTPAHYACQGCMQDGRRVVLQQGWRGGYMGNAPFPILFCPSCKTEIYAAAVKTIGKS